MSKGGLKLGQHALELDPSFVEKDAESRVECRTLYAWKTACSPHLAVQKEGHTC